MTINTEINAESPDKGNKIHANMLTVQMAVIFGLLIMLWSSCVERREAAKDLNLKAMLAAKDLKAMITAVPYRWNGSGDYTGLSQPPRPKGRDLKLQSQKPG